MNIKLLQVCFLVFIIHDVCTVTIENTTTVQNGKTQSLSPGSLDKDLSNKNVTIPKPKVVATSPQVDLTTSTNRIGKVDKPKPNMTKVQLVHNETKIQLKEGKNTSQIGVTTITALPKVDDTKKQPVESAKKDEPTDEKDNNEVQAVKSKDQPVNTAKNDQSRAGSQIKLKSPDQQINKTKGQHEGDIAGEVLLQKEKSQPKVDVTTTLQPEQDKTNNELKKSDKIESPLGEKTESTNNQPEDNIKEDQHEESDERNYFEDTKPGTNDEVQQKNLYKESKNIKINEKEESHFFFYFMILMFLTLFSYVLYHNRRKVFAYLCKSGSRRKTGSRNTSNVRYDKLVPSNEARSSTNTYVF